MATPKSLSTIKSFRILGAFRRRDDALTNAQISRRSGLPASSVRRLLLTLMEIGAVERAGSMYYRLGPLLHSLGRHVHVRDCLLDASREALWTLGRRLDLPVCLGVLDNHMLTYIGVFAPPGVAAAVTGAQYEAYSSAIGRVLLAALPTDRLDRFLASGELVALTPFTVTDGGAFRAELDRIGRDGFAVEREETCLGTASVAVPICDDNGGVHAAISVDDAACNFTPVRRDALRGALCAAAGTIQRILFPSAVSRVPALSGHGPPRASRPSGSTEGAWADR